MEYAIALDAVREHTTTREMKYDSGPKTMMVSGSAGVLVKGTLIVMEAMLSESIQLLHSDENLDANNAQENAVSSSGVRCFK